MSGTKLKTVYYEIQGQTEHLDKAVARSEKKLAAFTRDGVRIPFQADSEPFEAGLRRSRVELTATDRAVQNLTNSFKGLGLAAGAYKAAQYAKQAVDLGDKYRSLEARLDLVTDGTENLKIVQDALFKSAQDGRQQYEGVVDLYVAAARSADTLGASQEQLLQFTDGVNGALVVSNRSSTQAAGALLQLGQALGKGVVQAEEFNSIQEGAPRILQAVAAGIGETGISYSELRNRVLEGKVTSKEFFDAFLKGSADIRREAATMPETAAGAFTKLENAVLSYLGKSATIKAGSQEIVAALNVLAENLDNVARLGITVGAVFGARLLGTAGDSITQFASEIAAARRETVSTAESAVAMANANEQLAREALETATANRAVAQTELTVAQARLDDVAATQAAIAAEREFQAARLATANREFRVGMGAGDRLPDGSMIAESSKQRAAAIRELADLRVKELGVAERQIVELAAEGKARGGLAAATVVQAEATAALGVASNTASAAQQKLAATTTLTGRALSAAGSLGSKALALIGGPLGAIVLGMYALYSVVKKVQQEAFQKYEDRAAAVSRENAKFAKSLDDVSVSALKAAEAIQRASLAQAGIRVGETSAALNAVLNGPRPSLINGPKNNAAVTEYEAKLSKAKKDHAAAVDAVSLAQANLTTVTEKLTTKQTSLNAEIESASKKFNASVAAAKLELERQTALRDAFGQSEEAIAELNAALDLKTKLSAIDAEFTGKQAEELRGYALEQAAVEKVMRQQALIAEVNKKLDEEAAEAKKKLADAAKDLAEAQKKEQAARDDLIRSHRESHEANQLTLQEQRDQIKLLGLSGEAARKFADDLLYAKKFAEFFEHTDATTAAQMAREFVANARAISNASAETDNWADGLQNIVGIVQLIGATLEQSGSNFGRSITKATTGLQSVLSGARGLANAGKDSQGNKLTGAANVISYVGPVGQVVGGFITVLDAMDAFGNKSKAKAAEVRARAEAFNDAIDLYARDITERGISSFRQQINTIGDQIGKLTNEALAVNGIAPVANRRETEASVRRQIDQAKATLAKAEQTARRPDLTVGQLATAVGQTQALPKLIARLEEVAATAHEAEKALRAEQAAKIATLREDLVGRRLRTAGSDAAASAREVELQQMREIANALSEFEGSDALTAYLDELKLVHAEEKARAETLRKQAAAQRILDDEIKALGLEGKGALAATVRSLSGQFSDIATIVDDLDLSTQAGLDGLKARARSLFEQFRADGEVTDDEQKILDALWRIFDLASDVFDSLAERVQRSLAKLQDDNDILGGDARTQFGRTVNAARGFNGVLDQILAGVDISSSAGVEDFRGRLQGLYVSLVEDGLTAEDAVIRDLIKQLLTSLGTAVDEGKQEVEQRLINDVANRARNRAQADRATSLLDLDEADAFTAMLVSMGPAFRSIFEVFDVRSLEGVTSAKNRLVALNATIDSLSDEQLMNQFGLTRDELIAAITDLDGSLDSLRSSAEAAAQAAIDLANRQREFAASSEDEFLRESGREREADLKAAKLATEKKVEEARQLGVSQAVIDQILKTGELKLSNINKRYDDEAAQALEAQQAAEAAAEPKSTFTGRNLGGASEIHEVRQTDIALQQLSTQRQILSALVTRGSMVLPNVGIPALPNTSTVSSSGPSGGVIINQSITVQLTSSLSTREEMQQKARELAPFISTELARALSMVRAGGLS